MFGPARPLGIEIGIEIGIGYARKLWPAVATDAGGRNQPLHSILSCFGLAWRKGGWGFAGKVWRGVAMDAKSQPARVGICRKTDG